MSTPSRENGLWRGVLVAMTTPFDPRLEVDAGAVADHAGWLLSRGVDGLVLGGSLGEGASLSPDERVRLVEDVAPILSPRKSLIAAVGATSTREAVELARRLAGAGAKGLLVLPPYAYRGDRREVREHFIAVIRATDRPCMLYNNPSAYGTDVTPEEILDLVEECPTLTGVKESSGDVRRITAIRSLLGDRIDVAVGLDDAVGEGLAAGAVGWVAGLANALPDESRQLFRLLEEGTPAEAEVVYRWFLPLLRMDTLPKFVQLIKLVESEMGVGTTRVRPPRRELEGDELNAAVQAIRDCLRHRPGGSPAPAP
jgi:1-pyrroline-4-hydroxy-2-carboxylate deaminase